MEDDTIKKKFIGVWELVNVDMRSLDGKDLGQGRRKGCLIYTEQGYVSAQLGYPQIRKFESENKLKATNKEIRFAFDTFDSYYGKYEIDKENEIIRHHIEFSLFPNWIGTTLERSYKFINDHLELKAVGEAEKIEYTLKWKLRAVNVKGYS
jgi:hypothetical protein